MSKNSIKSLVSKLKIKEVKLLSSYKKWYIGKNVFEVTLNDGSKKHVEQILKNGRNGDAVVIIPITEEGKFIMIVQSRPNTKEEVLVEFPAGMIDEGEDSLASAKRELLEETGYISDDFKEIEWHYQDQGCSQAIIRIYVAEGCHKVQEQRLDGGERLKPIEMTYSEILKLIQEGNLVNDASTKLGFMNYTMKKKGLL